MGQGATKAIANGEQLAVEGEATSGLATIAIVIVPVITGLVSLRGRREVSAENTVTALGQFAVAGAGIIIIIVVVIAGFDIGLYMPIATAGENTGAGAPVGIDFIPIVAIFALAHLTIAAASRSAVVTAVEGILVVAAVVAALSITANIVTTTG